MWKKNLKITEYFAIATRVSAAIVLKQQKNGFIFLPFFSIFFFFFFELNYIFVDRLEVVDRLAPGRHRQAPLEALRVVGHRFRVDHFAKVDKVGDRVALQAQRAFYRIYKYKK